MSTRKRSSVDHPWEVESPFLDQELLAAEPEQEPQAHAAATAEESPFLGSFEEGAEYERDDEPEVIEENEQLWSFSQDCRKLLKGTRVAVVGGGLAGLMAARRLGQHGITVHVYEARPQVGGRVLSNTTFSNGRITEEGAELVGSFHTRWLALAREYGLAMISRMDERLYHRAGLNVKLTLDNPLSMDEIIKLWEEVGNRVLQPMARHASQIKNESRPWDEPGLKGYDNTSVADALLQIYRVKRGERLWKALEFLLVNNEVASLEEMNFLGLLCKVKAGQTARFTDQESDEHLMGYWNELEIFRCADGCQKLAEKIAEEIRNKYSAKIMLNQPVTSISLTSKGVSVWVNVKVPQADGKVVYSPVAFPFDYVILATPPSVWDRVGVSVQGKDGRFEKVHLKDEIGLMGMGPAVKFFSDMKERFWIKEGAAPYGGSLTLGQVWEGTENQTRAGKQGIVLSVFAGPTVTDPQGQRRVPTQDEFKKGLRLLYPGYANNLNKTLFRDWTNEAFIKTGYASPRKGQIFTIGKKLSEPFRGRMFFAGEHTNMAFFGYMEGALRSGESAADNLMLQSCGLVKDRAPAPNPRVLTASAAAIRKSTAFARASEILQEQGSFDHDAARTESPFLRQELVVNGSDETWASGAVALAAESPVEGAFEEYRSRFGGSQLSYEVESETERRDIEDADELVEDWENPRTETDQDIDHEADEGSRHEENEPDGAAIQLGTDHFLITDGSLPGDIHEASFTGSSFEPESESDEEPSMAAAQEFEQDDSRADLLEPSDADADREFLTEREIAALLPPRVFPAEEADTAMVAEEVPPLPKGVPAFEHFFQPMKRDSRSNSWIEDGTVTRLESIDPGFLDANGKLQTGALHKALSDLLVRKPEFSRYLSQGAIREGKAQSGDRLRVALVDLTGKKLIQPEIAGWGSVVAVEGASCPKIVPLYGAYQLMNDLKHVARAKGITSTKDLIKTMGEEWKKLRVTDPPKLSGFLDPSKNPPSLAFSKNIEEALSTIIDAHQANRAARILISQIGFPYLASLVWQTGLRHPERGGLWLTSSYDKGWGWGNAPRPAPGPVFGHNATALSLATFFTLLAQNRLVNGESSRKIIRRLSTASWFREMFPAARIASKVGLLKRCKKWVEVTKNGSPVLGKDNKPQLKCAQWETTHAHEAGLIENGRLRYAFAIMTVGIPEGVSLMQQLMSELASLIESNNP